MVMTLLSHSMTLSILSLLKKFTTSINLMLRHSHDPPTEIDPSYVIVMDLDSDPL